MGLILDSSIIIAAERRGDTVEKLIEQIIATTGDQYAALTSIGLTELAHGIYRAQNSAVRERRQAFVDELIHDLTIYPFTSSAALLAAKIDGEQQAKGVTIPLGDLLIGATALDLGFSVLTINIRHFRLIPNLIVATL